MRRFLPALLLATALLPPRSAAASQVFALSAGAEINEFFYFDITTPAIFTGSGMNGVVTGDIFVALDVRPATGGILMLAVNGGLTRLYRMDLSTTTAIPVGFEIVFSINGATAWGMDVDPVTDTVRVVNDLASDGPGGNANNFRLDPDSGALLGVDPDLDYSAVGGASGPEAAIAFAASGEAFGILSGADRLVRHAGAAPGFATLQDVGSLGVEVTSVAGFDIVGSPEQGLAILEVGGNTGLYTIDLATGAATLVGLVGNGTSDFGGMTVERGTTLLGAAELVCEHSPAVAATRAAKPEVIPDAPAGASDCGRLCTKWTSTCRGLVSVMKSCWQNAGNRVSSIRNADCNTLSDGGTRSVCKDALKAEKKALKGFLAEEIESGRELCDGEGLTQCILNCS
jgi:hypothetical protein